MIWGYHYFWKHPYIKVSISEYIKTFVAFMLQSLLIYILVLYTSVWTRNWKFVKCHPGGYDCSLGTGSSQDNLQSQGTFEADDVPFLVWWDMWSFPEGTSLYTWILLWCVTYLHGFLIFFVFQRNFPRDFEWKIEVYFGRSVPCVVM